MSDFLFSTYPPRELPTVQLWLQRSQLLAGKLAQVLAVLQEGLTTPEHRDFVQKLASQTELS